MVRVRSFTFAGPCTLHIIFDDGAERTINFEPVLHGCYYAPLRDLDVFRRARLDTEVATLVWPNGADSDPATLYDWNRGDGAESERKVGHWRQAQADPMEHAVPR
jgi:hypothetical protein